MKYEYKRSVDSVEARYLDELLGAIRHECTTRFNPVDYFGPGAERDFRATLLVHHCFLKSPLATSSFEAAFKRAVHVDGHDVQDANEGQRFWDVVVNGKHLSLKTTAASNLREGTLHISKLCEAAWIQDMRSAAMREERTKSLFREYADTVDAIIQLRLFRKQNKYELVEIPGALFEQVADVPRAEFNADGPSINIPVGKEPPDFMLKLDRSDAKVTIGKINKDVCRVIGVWKIPS